jgi:hypothetical protein
MIKNSLFLAIALATASGAAVAAKADKNAGLYQGMDAAGQRYREARIKMQSGDKTGMAQMTKAPRPWKTSPSSAFASVDATHARHHPVQY